MVEHQRLPAAAHANIKSKTYLCFFVSPNRPEESEEMSLMKELSSVSEPTQIRLGLL